MRRRKVVLVRGEPEITATQKLASAPPRRGREFSCQEAAIEERRHTFGAWPRLRIQQCHYKVCAGSIAGQQRALLEPRALRQEILRRTDRDTHLPIHQLEGANQ